MNILNNNTKPLKDIFMDLAYLSTSLLLLSIRLDGLKIRKKLNKSMSNAYNFNLNNK